LPTGSPSATDVPESIEPSSAPTDTPVPTKTPKPTAAVKPNLVVTKFELDADVLVIESPFVAVFTVKNIGDGDAGPFTAAVGETNVDDPQPTVYDPSDPIDGLASGASKKVSISVSVQTAGFWTFTAVADLEKSVDESDETDNAKDVTAKVRPGLPDLEWETDGFAASYSGESGSDGYKIDLDAKVRNSGTDALDQTIFIGLTWYDEAGHSGDLVSFPIADDIPPGGSTHLQKIDFLPGPGTYTIYATIDVEHVLYELNYDNNQAQVTLTIN
jgi:hypothetical protein